MYPMSSDADASPSRVEMPTVPLLRWAAFIVAFLALDFVSYVGSSQSPEEINWNLGIGLCLALVVKDGYRAAIPVLTANAIGNLLFHDGSHYWASSLLNVLLSTTESVVPLILARRFSTQFRPGILSAVWARAILFAVPLSLLCNLVRIWPDLLFEIDWGAVLQLWASSLTGILVISPLSIIIAESRITFAKVTATWIWDLLAQTALGFAFLWFVFVFSAGQVREYFYILSLPLMWISLRHGVRGAAIANLVILASLMLFLSLSAGGDDRIVQLPMRMLVLNATALILGLTADEGRAAARRLRDREQALSTNLKAGETSELAGTLAHELSHPIGAISNYAAVIAHSLERKENIDKELTDIVARLRGEVKRAAETIKRLREFFRSGSLRLELLDVAQLVRESVVLLANKFEASGISVKVSSSLGVTYVTADAIQLHSVVHNVLINAIDALAPISSSSKAVTIRIAAINNLVELTVEDSGPGIADDVFDDIFDPMTTTKKNGLGLGLSMSKSIVLAHGGAITAGRSNLGGAKFVVQLPVAKDQ